MLQYLTWKRDLVATLLQLRHWHVFAIVIRFSINELSVSNSLCRLQLSVYEFPMFACLKFVLWLLQLWLCAGVSGNLPDPVTEYVRTQFPKEVLQHLGWDKDLGHQVFSIKRIYHSYEMFAGTAGITHACKA